MGVRYFLQNVHVLRFCLTDCKWGGEGEIGKGEGFMDVLHFFAFSE